jgi:uncharacterized ferritin-like protein (DUF455 family)
MNVTEFAEQVVFGTTLEDKLLAPGPLIHGVSESRGTRVLSVAAPGRPAGLQMRQGHGTVQPPSDDQLENEHARGQLLHFLANHELLATELMALVLLKFPEAPRAFRQGILVTLQEEQEHTRMYIRRMKECGVEFGSFPVSGQFWRMIEPIQSPMDFVARLSLTFEQANLDYSLHFASVFRKLGDTQTANVLQRIYEDEIGHVKHGLHWFRQWKNQEQSDWEAYQECLEFPMSPQRALGLRGTFNRDGRVKAGLTDDFINSIEVFRQSRGRAPTVRWFDPGAEAELAGEISPREIPLLEQLGRDLELVMVPMAKQDDIVLVRRMPSRGLCKQLIDVGFDLPQFIPLDERTKLDARKLNGFSPWAWTPKNYDVAHPLIESTHYAPSPWSEESCALFRKSWGANRLRKWLAESDRLGERPDWFASEDCAGITVNTASEIPTALAKLAEQGYATAIFKQDLGASGRGQRRLGCSGSLIAEDEKWLRSKFASLSDANDAASARQPAGVIEPELDRLIDLSFLWLMPRDARSPTFLGWTRPLVTVGRRYCGTRLGSSLSDCDTRLKRFMLADRAARLQTVTDWLEPRITAELNARNFSGYFGVDAIVYQDVSGDLKIKPLVELNPRMTMGHVALRLGKRLAPGTDAEFRILTKSEWDEAQEELASIPLTQTRDGRWKSGVIWLGEVGDDTKLIPVLLIGSLAIAKTLKATTDPRVCNWEIVS